MTHEHMTDRELLVVIHDDIKDLNRAVYGNGRPGLIERVTTLEAGRKGRAAMLAGMVAAVAGAIGASVKAMV